MLSVIFLNSLSLSSSSTSFPRKQWSTVKAEAAAAILNRLVSRSKAKFNLCSITSSPRTKPKSIYIANSRLSRLGAK